MQLKRLIELVRGAGEALSVVLAPGLDDLEPRLARHGYNARILAHELNIRSRLQGCPVSKDYRRGG